MEKETRGKLWCELEGLFKQDITRDQFIDYIDNNFKKKTNKESA